ncbi:hypothetical protein FJTKL_02135 [Diaporthe vaccinii]|uniref:Uncharacterized protein n=1 Tax=Diaporthe vaccinii TaxID=105482 RepID=A0ABR4DYT7_9PEZI
MSDKLVSYGTFSNPDESQPPNSSTSDPEQQLLKRLKTPPSDKPRTSSRRFRLEFFEAMSDEEYAQAKKGVKNFQCAHTV